MPAVHVPEGKILRHGMKDTRVIALRKRLDIKGDKDQYAVRRRRARRGGADARPSPELRMTAISASTPCGR